MAKKMQSVMSGLSNKYGKWVGRYDNCTMSHFTFEHNAGLTILVHKGVKFASLDEKETREYEKLSPKEKERYLNGFWNFYMSIND